ncbi:MAG: hypothetical protein Ta2B_13590 [Termitinemataceae bacterium]|nr:MAG: hypothetical protein Ta2B_13590 [Termitinemataceae bacterium]
MSNKDILHLLSQVSTIIAGQASSSETYNKDRVGLPFYQGKVDFGDISPTPRVWFNEPIRIAESGDILSVRAPVGPTNIASEKCCIGRELCAIRVNQDVDKSYVLAFFKLYETNIAKMGSGSTFKAITNEQIQNIEIPPLAEQRRIAAIIDAKLTAVDKAKRLLQEQSEAINAISAAILRKVFAGEI